METAYSLSDLASVVRDSDGFGGGNSWVLVLLFLLILWGGNGFNKNGQGELGQYATAASQQQILFNQQFDALGQKINAIGDGLCSSTYALNNAIQNEGRSLQTEMSSCCCSIKDAIHSEGEATRSMIAQNKIESLQSQLSTVQMQQAIQNAMCGVPKINPYMYGIVPSYTGCNCGNI